MSVSVVSPVSGACRVQRAPAHAGGRRWALGQFMWVDKILYRWSVVKCLPTKPGVASVGREAVGVVRASVRRIAAVITIAIKHGQIRRSQIRKHVQGKEGAKWRVGLLLSRSRRCARRVQRGGHRIAIRAQRQNRRSALHSAVNHASGRARSNRIKIQQECTISQHRTVFGVHHAIDLPRSRIRCLQCRAC